MRRDFARTPAGKEQGLALLAVIAIIIILGVVASAFVTQIIAHRQTAASPLNSLKAFYLSEGALEIGKKYIVDREGQEPAWSPTTELFVDEALGEGTFSLSINWESGSTFVSFTASAAVSDGG